MTDDSNSSVKKGRERKRMKDYGGSGMAGFALFVAFIGAAVYYIQQATSFGMGVVGFLKALVWPAFLIYDVFKFINM